MIEQAARGPIPIEQIRERILKGIRHASFSGNRRPRAVIEMKQNVRGFWAVRPDLARVTAALGNKENSLECGILAFFMAMPHGVQRAAEDRVRTRYESLVAKSRQFAGSQGLRLEARSGGVRIDVGVGLAVTLVVR